MRVLFVADIHGADLILRKSLQAITEYEASVLILAGDLSGKSLYPIVRREDGNFSVQRGHGLEIFSAFEVGQLERDLAERGRYCLHCSQADVRQLQEDGARVNQIFTGLIIDRLERWRDMIAARLDLRAVQVLITPGNDDPPELDGVLKSFEKAGIFANLSEPFDLGVNEIITLDYTNLTPWNTPREVSELELAKKIDGKARKLKRPERAIFNFHCPPFRTKLDLAPKLDRNLRPVTDRGAETHVHVGSTAVRKSIEDVQPLLSLHGHIHESPGEDLLGRTVCLNPGSEYWAGILHAYIVDLDKDGNLKNYFHIEG